MRRPRQPSRRRRFLQNNKTKKCLCSKHRGTCGRGEGEEKESNFNHIYGDIVFFLRNTITFRRDSLPDNPADAGSHHLATPCVSTRDTTHAKFRARIRGHMIDTT